MSASIPLSSVRRTYCNASEGAGSHVGRQREVRWKRFIAEARVSTSSALCVRNCMATHSYSSCSSSKSLSCAAIGPGEPTIAPTMLGVDDADMRWELLWLLESSRVPISDPAMGGGSERRISGAGNRSSVVQDRVEQRDTRGKAGVRMCVW